MVDGRFDEARLDVRVERDLRVTVKPVKDAVGPGDEVAVELTAVDQLGKPVAAEIALALVDRTLLRRFEDHAGPIGPFFYDQTRTGAFATRSTNTFRDEPATRPVSSAVVEEADRQTAEARDKDGRAEWQGQAQVGMGFRAPLAAKRRTQDPAAEATPAPASAPPALGRMGGGRLRDKYGDDSFDALEMGRDRLERDMARDDRGDLDRANIPREMTKSYADIPAPARERFAETAYWNPSIVTGPDGKATVRFKAPSSLAEYRFSAKGVTGLGHLGRAGGRHPDRSARTSSSS